MHRRNTYKRRFTRRRKNRRFSRKRLIRATKGQKQRGGSLAYRPPSWATASYWVAGEDEAPRIMTAEEIEEKRTEDDKGV